MAVGAEGVSFIQTGVQERAENRNRDNLLAQ